MAPDTVEPIERWTAKRRVALVLGILKGETSVAEAARTHGLTVAEIEDWHDRFLLGAENALRSRPKDEEALKEEQIKASSGTGCTGTTTDGRIKHWGTEARASSGNKRPRWLDLKGALQNLPAVVSLSIPPSMSGRTHNRTPEEAIAASRGQKWTCWFWKTACWTRPIRSSERRYKLEKGIRVGLSSNQSRRNDEEPAK